MPIEELLESPSISVPICSRRTNSQYPSEADRNAVMWGDLGPQLQAGYATAASATTTPSKTTSSLHGQQQSRSRRQLRPRPVHLGLVKIAQGQRALGSLDVQRFSRRGSAPPSSAPNRQPDTSAAISPWPATSSACRARKPSASPRPTSRRAPAHHRRAAGRTPQADRAVRTSMQSCITTRPSSIFLPPWACLMAPWKPSPPLHRPQVPRPRPASLTSRLILASASALASTSPVPSPPLSTD